MKLAVIAYVSPPSHGQPQVFMDNLKKFPTKHPLILFSDHNWDWPGLIKLKGSPETVKKLSREPWAVNNMVFFTAMRVAVGNGVTHALYVESDSRVGCPGWDDIMFSEYFGLCKPAICGGSMVVYNPCNAGALAAQRWGEICGPQGTRNRPIITYLPVPTYGHKSAADGSGSCVFVNGSLGIYDMAWITKLFNLAQSDQVAVQSQPWDMEIGHRIWAMFGPDSYFLVHHLHSVYSSFGNVLTTEIERLEMVRSGKVVATHQVKSDLTV